MLIGVPTEVKNNEFRVGLTPAGALELVHHGHEVRIQAGAGEGSGYPDALYAAAGAVVTDVDGAWGADLVIKVKEPIAVEYPRLRADQTLFTYLHLAADRPLTDALLASGTTAIAYETVQLPDRSLPLLAPMSEVAGRLSIQVGGAELMKGRGGRGVLLGGVPGTPKANVVVIGAGVAGESAARMALGMNADVTVLDVSIPRLRQIDAVYGGRIKTLRSNAYTIAEELTRADLVIGSVLIPGAAAPKLVTVDMVAAMAPGSVLVDIAIDQGGCFEGSRPTTHDEPTFPVEGSLYYCVANMPGAVPRTSTQALTNATIPYATALADLGTDAAFTRHPELAAGLSTRGGELRSRAVGDALGIPAS
ncbi:alanine dehydrogenase [Microbacterium sp. NPDC055903]